MGSIRCPRFVVLNSKCNKKCLNYLKEEGQVHRYLQFSGEQAVSPEAKFEVVTAQGNHGLVHIRCCYNNRYWTRPSSQEFWIVAAAEKPEADRSKWSCTLFKPIFLDDAGKTVRFMHLQSGNDVCLWTAAEPFNACLHAGSKNLSQDFGHLCTIIDWESLVILPKHVAVKGDNGKYLRSHSQDYYYCLNQHAFLYRHYLQFSATDKGDLRVGHEIFHTSNGSIRIKSDGFGQFWKRSPNWIWADTDDTITNDSDTLFWPVKVDNNLIALGNLGNNKFCRRFTNEDITDCLNPDIPTIYNEAKLEVEELVIARQIYDIKYRLEDARIYEEQVLTLETGAAINKVTEPTQVGVKLRYKETNSRTWNNSLSLKSGVSVTFEAGVPVIRDSGIEISSEFDKSYQWGETNEREQELHRQCTVTVPPMTKVTLRMIATRASCDVPFSYAQRDTLINGQHEVQYLDDGIFTGTNYFNFMYESEGESCATLKKIHPKKNDVCGVASLETLTRLNSSTRGNQGV